MQNNEQEYAKTTTNRSITHIRNSTGFLHKKSDFKPGLDAERHDKCNIPSSRGMNSGRDQHSGGTLHWDRDFELSANNS